MLLCQSECNASLMSQGMKGKMAIVLLKAPFNEGGPSGNRSKISRLCSFPSNRICFGIRPGCKTAYRKLREKKISALTSSKSSLLGDMLSRRNHGA